MISERWAVSVLLKGDLGSRKVSGRLVAGSDREAVEGLAFLLSAKARQDGAVWFIGPDSEKVVRSFPAYGLTTAELRGAIKEGVSVVGGRVVVDADPVKAAQIGEVLGGFSNRLSLTMELLVLDVASNQVERVNAWLDQVNVAAGYATKSALPAFGAASAASAVVDRGWTWDVNLSTLWSFLDVGDAARIELRQQVRVLSGSQTKFESGEVIETPVILREPQTGRDLVSQIDRRTVGLVVTLGASYASGHWVMDLEIQDGSFAAGREVRTGLKTQTTVRVGERMALLGSYTRATVASSEKGVPVLSSIPKLGKALFRKSTVKRGNRSVVVLCRPIMESVAGQP